MPPPAPSGDDDLDAQLEDEPWARPAARPHRASRRPTSAPAPVRRWSPTDEPGPAEDDELELDDEPKRRDRPPVFWRARDSLYFEPLVALAILAILLVSLFAYTANWPPVYVVESNSMQHGSGDHVGYLNAGDIVLAQRVSQSTIVPYVQGWQTGFMTYGEYGDVLLYYPDGSSKTTPIIHRAIIYLQFNPKTGAYNATGLTGDACGNDTGAFYSTPGTLHDCGTTNLDDVLYLNDVGGRSVTVDFSRVADLGEHSGYLTLGDNNSLPDQLPALGTAPLSSLVEPGWVIGVARGMIPWFGAFKLLLDGNSQYVPDASWEYLGLSIAGIIFAGAGVHLLLRRIGRDRERRRPRPADEEEDDDEPVAPRRPVRPVAGRGVRSWQPPRSDADPEPRDAPARAARRVPYEQRRRSHFVTAREQNPDRRHRPERKGGHTDDDAPDEAAEDDDR